MKLGFDARMYGLEHAGIGRYVMNVVDRLIAIPDLSLTLFISPAYAHKFQSYKHVSVVTSSVRHYSLAEQISFLSTLNRYQFDLLHVPHFNVPYFYRKPFVVTIHDILWHQVRGSSVTTLSPLQYYVKYQGYKVTVRHAIQQSKAILVPSEYVKHDLLASFRFLQPEKIHVTYEGVSLPTTSNSAPPKPYVLYVGSAYPHKNLEIVLQALQTLDIQFKIVGSRSIFLDRIKHQAQALNVADKVEFLGPQSDATLHQLLTTATALVHPSKSEGFGLTGLEAMAAGCPVIAANATALPEIYGSAALYFNPDDAADLVAKINTLRHNLKQRQQLITLGKIQVQKYSWDKMVQQTVQVYRQVI